MVILHSYVNVYQRYVKNDQRVLYQPVGFFTEAQRVWLNILFDQQLGVLLPLPFGKPT
jgi:hypothetical protein